MKIGENILSSQKSTHISAAGICISFYANARIDVKNGENKSDFSIKGLYLCLQHRRSGRRAWYRHKKHLFERNGNIYPGKAGWRSCARSRRQWTMAILNPDESLILKLMELSPAAVLRKDKNRLCRTVKEWKVIDANATGPAQRSVVPSSTANGFGRGVCKDRCRNP